MRFRKTLAAAVALGAAIPAALAASDWKARLSSGITAEDANARIAAIRAVEVDDKGGVKALLQVLSMKETNRVDAHVRAAAIDQLATAKEEKARDEIAKALGAKDPIHREAAALALGKLKSAEHRAALAKALDDKDPAVRRAAARGLALSGDLEGVDALLGRWKKVDKARDRDYREVLSLVDALEKLTEEKTNGRDLAKWTAFWDASKDGFKRPSEMSEEERKAAEEARKKAAEGKNDGITTVEREEVSTTVRDIPLTYTASGRGPIPLLVIHEDSWKPEYFQPYLSSLEEICRIYYIELPSITKVPIKKRELGMPFWPYDELCDAFDEIRKSYKHEKFAIMAHGFSCMIAARYLTKYSENVSHAIMVGAVASDDSYGGVLLGVRAKATGQWKDPELRRAVDSHFISDAKTRKKDYQPKTDEELEALDRKFFTLMFANPQDPDIADLWLRCRKPASLSLKVAEEEISLSPPYDIGREKKANVPVLVISGAKSNWFGPADGKRVAENYPMGQHVVLQNSAMMPWFEENGAFTEAVKAFFAKNPYAGGATAGAGKKGK